MRLTNGAYRFPCSTQSIALRASKKLEAITQCLEYHKIRGTLMLEEDDIAGFPEWTRALCTCVYWQPASSDSKQCNGMDL